MIGFEGERLVQVALPVPLEMGRYGFIRTPGEIAFRTPAPPVPQLGGW